MISEAEINKYLPNKEGRYKSLTILYKTILDTFLSDLLITNDYQKSAQNTLDKLTPFGVTRNKLNGALSIWKAENHVHYLFKQIHPNRGKNSSTKVKEELLSVAQIFYNQSDMTWEQLKDRLGVS